MLAEDLPVITFSYIAHIVSRRNSNLQIFFEEL